MFRISLQVIEKILRDYKISSKVLSFSELQRYDYEKNNPHSREVRLIVKVELDNKTPLVVRFRNEIYVSPELVEKQSEFAALLKENGIETPALYKSESGFAKWYSIYGYDVIVTVEEFVNGELKYVDDNIAEKTGGLLAKMHNIAEEKNFHVKNSVLFDPFGENELFAASDFLAHSKELAAVDSGLYQDIAKKYREYMDILSPVRNEPRYAVQGDISNCNLYQTDNFSLGVFDFNRCGDNYLYCDAIMQAVFEARLMDYSKSCEKEQAQGILSAFLKGYHANRPFSDLHKRVYPYLYAIIHAFWSADIKWKEDCLLKELAQGNHNVVHRQLEEVRERLFVLEMMPL